ncbi:MAG: hypothetical protein JST59_24045 [Actinobacteria bacterium]|nr:hypothetical protein [Actinomycetota bacterium]
MRSITRRRNRQAPDLWGAAASVIGDVLMAMLTTAEVAVEVKMSEDWVRDHAPELGGIRAGRTKRAPLRFEPEGIEAWKRDHRVGSPTPGRSRRRRSRARRVDDVELLPLPPATGAGSSRSRGD